MKIVSQLSIFLENHPGTLAKVCRALAHNKININAMSVSDTVDHAVVRLVVSDPGKALSLFEETGTLAIANDVLMIEKQNEPGVMAKLADKLARAKINIEYLYATGSKAHKDGMLILRVQNPKKALAILKK